MKTKETRVKAVAFCRVSSEQQSYERQIEDLLPLIEKDGYKREEIHIIKYKESASKNDFVKRLSVQELVKVIDSNPIEAVYVTEISRMARRDDVMYEILAILEKNEIALVVMTPSLIRTYERNTKGEWIKNSMAHVIISFFIQAAEVEIVDKTNRQKSGMANKIKAGKVISGSLVFGYMRDNEMYAHPDPTNSQIVIDIFNKYLEGKSVAVIWEEYKHTGIFSDVNMSSGRKNITSILRNKTYIGQHPKFKYPALMDEELFNAVQNKMDENRLPTQRIGEQVAYLSGILKVNGRCMTPNFHDCQYTFKDPNKMLPSCGVNANVVEAIAWQAALEAKAQKNVEDDRERMAELQERLVTTEAKLEGIKKAMDELDVKQEKVLDLYLAGKLSKERYEARIDDMEYDMASLRKEFDTLEVTRSSITNTLQADARMDRAVVDYNQLAQITDDNMKRDIIRETVREITVEILGKGHLKISVQHTNPANDTEAWYEYTQAGCKIKLWEHYDEVYGQDVTGCWENRIKSRRRK